MPATLKKSGILRGRAAFTRLFTTGKTQSAGAIRCFYNTSETATDTVQVGFTVTRSIKNAATRNRIKRLMREVWRQRRSRVLTGDYGLQIAFLYSKPAERKSLTLQHIDSTMQKLIDKLNNNTR